ncbi:MAG: PepSY domain-containing protein [Burkholderiaceae bacterium]|nr:PepSY domain-containing protein [Burkholderiaceae bacterium]
MSVNCAPAPPCPASRAGRVAARALAGLLVLAGLLAPAQAHDDDDHERARAALRAGEVLPLSTLLERLQRRHPGQVLEVELERDDGRWIYEVKLLRQDGLLFELALDARSGEVLSQRQKNGRSGGRQR